MYCSSCSDDKIHHLVATRFLEAGGTTPDSLSLFRSCSPSAGSRPGPVRRSAHSWLSATHRMPSRSHVLSNTTSSNGSTSMTLLPVSVRRKSIASHVLGIFSTNIAAARGGAAADDAQEAASPPVTAYLNSADLSFVSRAGMPRGSRKLSARLLPRMEYSRTHRLIRSAFWTRFTTLMLPRSTIASRSRRARTLEAEATETPARAANSRTANGGSRSHSARTILPAARPFSDFNGRSSGQGARSAPFVSMNRAGLDRTSRKLPVVSA